MGKVSGNWLTGVHSGRACNHEDIYTKVNRKTGACYSVKLCNPSSKVNENQLLTQNAFSLVSKAVNAWLTAEKEANSADYRKAKLMYDKQSRYASLRGMIIAKGMYLVSEDKQTVTVDLNATTNFRLAFGIVSGDAAGSNPSNPSNPSNESFDGLYMLSLMSNDEDLGSVTNKRNGLYAPGSRIDISATPSEGAHFVRWSDGDTNETRTLTMNRNYNLVAYFE